ncbi:polyadenylation and cleavage factor like protein 11 [Ditylenchus destructor]|nr:polyadenylation and cleavage factor like protein 11 [Ditylenchus destructor]
MEPQTIGQTNTASLLGGYSIGNLVGEKILWYTVFYLENVAVIERNGVPHRVSFNGPPRDIIIDGVAHKMAFGEQKSLAKRDYNRCRRWFMTQNWFDFSETEAVNSTVSQEAKDATKTCNDTKDVCSEDASLKLFSKLGMLCMQGKVRGILDSGSWRFRNSVEENGALLHRTCVNEIKDESKD